MHPRLLFPWKRSVSIAGGNIQSLFEGQLPSWLSPPGLAEKRGSNLFRATGVPRFQETATPQDSTVGLCLGSKGGPRGVGVFL